MLNKPTLPKFYRNSENKYLGSFSGIQSAKIVYEDGSELIINEGSFPEIPEDAIEVPSAPSNALALWNGEAWVEPV